MWYVVGRDDRDKIAKQVLHKIILKTLVTNYLNNKKNRIYDKTYQSAIDIA